jgi:glycosyltransferase involved in cell wall biosynthesis
MLIAHLMASPFYGGPERQMLGLARHLPTSYRSVFLSFAENGQARPFLDQVEGHGFEGRLLERNAPHLRQAVREVTRVLRSLRADILCCSGYKPDIIGWLAARQIGLPVISVSHGWTGATFKVRLYESLDRFMLRWMDAVVCVSSAQADKVRRMRVPDQKITVIRNAVPAEAFAPAEPAYGALLRQFFLRPPRRIIGAAGRLSPEKGFAHLVAAAATVVRQNAEIGFVLFGEGPLRNELTRQIAQFGLRDRVVLAGFRADVHKFLPHLDLAVLPSFTEGLPVVLLEALAAGVPVVATAVGGSPEIIEEGRCGFLVPPGDPATLARRILAALEDEPARRAMGECGRRRVREHFSCETQSLAYQRLFQTLLHDRKMETGIPC